MFVSSTPPEKIRKPEVYKGYIKEILGPNDLTVINQAGSSTYIWTREFGVWERF